MVVKRASLPNVLVLTSLRRSSCRDIVLPLEGEQAQPIFREDEDSDRSSHASDGLGHRLDFSVKPRKGQWTSKADFIFSCISYAVGLGNVWRFPYLCYENGGGAFLVPYFTCLLTTAVPVFYLEVAVGQYLGKGGIGVWTLAPMFKGMRLVHPTTCTSILATSYSPPGIGIASLVVLTLSNVYYMVVVAWILFYLIASFSTVLPWKHCGNYWNTDKCREHNDTHPTPPHNGSVTPIVEFWENHVLGITSGLHEIGNMRMEIALYLFVAWATVYLVIWRGLHQSGKIVWVSAIFPYVCLFILLVRGVTLSGATNGLFFYIKPDWSQLLKPKVWIAAGTQVFYSYGVGFGSLMTLGSYNDFHQNFFRDSAIVCIVNPMTSLLSGTVIFAVLGHMASLAGKTVGDVVRSGPGLAFLVYPEVVARMPASAVWSILFFVMLLFLGINSQFCPSEAIVSALIDQWPRLVTRRRIITLCLVVFQFLLGLPMTTEGGMYIFQLMDYYAVSGITLLFIVFFQAVALAWIYGTRNLSDNIKEMIGRRPILLLRLGWKVFIPAMCVAIFLFSVIKYEPLVYADTYAYPWWAEMMGWFISLSSITMIPAYMVYFLLTTPGSLRQEARAQTEKTIVRESKELFPGLRHSMVMKRASLPDVFSVKPLRRSSCRGSSNTSLTTQQELPIYRRQPEDKDQSSSSDSRVGSPVDRSATPKRGKWAGKADFVFSCISYAVGLGNVWRFPYLCYENGGGAFLVPYVICLLTTAVPVFYLEVAMGQYLSKGGIGIWAVAPMFKDRRI
ncbi:hypothetical protein HPB50_012594 [Hyalomma asiaticum]|uniref:Uncharacterized protein n=1 Tax=Hyalomma asiaticum TaxID=266040 RepID=A0ACB7S3I4_HYAAI|nr:hypothetical protein HPB50_012594 [Hyalomma asiaticum]